MPPPSTPCPSCGKAFFAQSLPIHLPQCQVKQAKLFFAEVEKLKKASAAGNAKEAALRYALAREALDVYLNDVELPPTFVPNEYVAPTDVTVPSLCQGSFCI